MSFLFSSLFGSKAGGPNPSFEEWLATTTRADVEALFLQVLKEGDAEDGLGRSLSHEELAHFDRVVSSLAGDSTLSPSTSISPTAVTTQLAEYHPRHAKAIHSSSDLLATLLQAHASFPFPPSAADNLTPPSLLRAIALLTGNSEKLLGAAGSIGDAVTIRKRTPKQRIAFIFSSLAWPPATPSVDDVVDVLSRVPYPRVKDRSTGDLRRRNIVDLTPAAERLLAQDTAKKDQYPTETPLLTAAVYHQLANLVVAFNGTSAVEGQAQDQIVIDIGTFERLAVEANLLGVLDKLFAPFLRKK